MQDLLGKDLAGWRIETWYELRLSKDDMGGYNIDGYFSNTDIAMATGRGRGWYGGDGTVEQVLVLTKDGETGYLVSDTLTEKREADENVLKQEAINKAKKKLTPEELKLLGLQ